MIEKNFFQGETSPNKTSSKEELRPETDRSQSPSRHSERTHARPHMDMQQDTQTESGRPTRSAKTDASSKMKQQQQLDEHSESEEQGELSTMDSDSDYCSGDEKDDESSEGEEDYEESDEDEEIVKAAQDPELVAIMNKIIQEVDLTNMAALKRLIRRLGYTDEVVRNARDGRMVEAVVNAIKMRCKNNDYVSLDDIRNCVNFVADVLQESLDPQATKTLVNSLFSPLFFKQGGRLSNVFQDLDTVFLLSLSAHMVESAAKFNKEGSAHEIALRDIFVRLVQLDPDNAAQALAAAYNTESPMDSAKADALRLAQQFGKLSPIEKVKVLFHNVLTSPYHPKKKLLLAVSGDESNYSRQDYDTKTLPQNYKDTMAKAGLMWVNVHVLTRCPENHAGKKLREIRLDAGTYEEEKFYVLGRASEVIADPSPVGVFKALDKILDENQEDPDHPKTKKLLSENKKPSLYVATTRAGKVLDRLGRRAPRVKTTDNLLLHYGVLGSDDNFARWVDYNKLDKKEFTSICLPPFVGYEPGVRNFYVLPSDDDSLPVARLDLAQAQKKVDKNCARWPANAARKEAEDAFRVQAFGGANPNKRKKRKLNPEEEEKLQDVCETAYKSAFDNYISLADAKPRKRVRIHFERSLLPLHCEKSNARSEYKEKARKEREALCSRGRAWLEASEENKKIAKAHPGGMDYIAAMNAFMATSTFV